MAFLDETGLAELWSCIADKYDWLYQHCWGRRTNRIEHSVYMSASSGASSLSITGTGDTSSSATVYYSDSYTVSENGKFVLSNPSQVDVSYSGYTKAKSLIGKYHHFTSGESDELTYIPADATISRFWDPDVYVYYVTASKGERYRIKDETVVSEWTFLFSTDRSAHPDQELANEIEYRYFGVPFKNAITGAKVATGYYTGTGACGSSNPCTLTFDFHPKMVIVYSGTHYSPYAYTAYTGSSFGSSHQVFYAGATNFGVYNGNLETTTFSLSGNTLTWYSAKGSTTDSYTPSCQMNASGAIYRYIAIG